MVFENIQIKDTNKEILSNALHSNHLNHSYIFIGPDGTYKKRTAIEFIKGILCGNNLENKPCNECVACKKITHGNHPDVIIVSPIDKSIKIKQIRDTQRIIRNKPYEVNKRIVLIENSETMGIPAQNALLKSLEEPNKTVIFILLCNSKEKMLTTILSRCQQLIFNPMSKEVFEINAVNGGMSLDDIDDYYALTQGCYGNIELLMKEPSTLDDYRSIKEYIYKIIDGQGEEIFKFAKWIKESKFMPLDITTYIIIILRDILYDIITNNTIACTSSNKLSGDMVLDMIVQMIELQRSINNNINIQLHIESIMLSIQEEIVHYDKSCRN